MSTTIVGEIIAEHDAKQRKQPPPTPKEVHARMIEVTNAANGLRYEIARFGDIERQLKAVHEKMEPLVLKAKELNDLICERVSQASQPWADSRIHESEELVQKVQQLERENAALRRPIDDPNAMHSHYLRKRNGWEVWQAGRIHRFQETVDKLERDNAELRNELASLKHQTQWQCSCGGTDCEGLKENAELRQQLADVSRVRYSLEDALTRSQAEAESCWGKKERLADAAEEVLRTYINVVRVTGHPCPEDLVICRQLRAAIDAARAKEDQS